MTDEPIDYTNIAHKLGTVCQDDAVRWAKAFCQIRAKHGFPIDEDNMRGWFANAIEIAHDHRTDHVEALINDAVQAEREACAQVASCYPTRGSWDANIHEAGGQQRMGQRAAASDIAKAIRERGEE